MPYRRLSPDLIIDTVAKLSDRMEQRFGGRGLTRVAQELTAFAREETGKARKLARPRFFLRSLVYLFILCGIAVIGYVGWTVKIDIQASPSLDMFEGVEAFINLLILLAAGVWFLLNLETRLKRHAVLERINQLRSIAHVVDMHQLSKDPMSDLHAGAESESAPESDLHGYELVRYLDYCADLLAITGKLAAVYLEYFDDPVIISSVNDFESMTGELSRKIWQKVTVLELQGGFSTTQPQTKNVIEAAAVKQNVPEATAAELPDELPDFLK